MMVCGGVEMATVFMATVFMATVLMATGGAAVGTAEARPGVIVGRTRLARIGIDRVADTTRGSALATLVMRGGADRTATTRTALAPRAGTADRDATS